MSAGRLFSTLVVLGLVVAPVGVRAQSGSDVTSVGSGSGSAGSGSSVATAPNPAPAPKAEIPDEETTVKDIAKAVSNKDWFLLAGALLAAVIHIVRYLLARKWPKWGESHYGVLIAAGLAAITALVVAWTSGGDVASTHTLLGAVKLMIAASATYVIPKKVAQGLAATGTASISDTPAP